jgi:hypothetical protein
MHIICVLKFIRSFGISLARIRIFCIRGAKAERFVGIRRAKQKRMNISGAKCNKFGIREKLWEEGKGF